MVARVSTASHAFPASPTTEDTTGGFYSAVCTASANPAGFKRTAQFTSEFSSSLIRVAY